MLLAKAEDGIASSYGGDWELSYEALGTMESTSSSIPSAFGSAPMHRAMSAPRLGEQAKEGGLEVKMLKRRSEPSGMDTIGPEYEPTIENTIEQPVQGTAVTSVETAVVGAASGGEEYISQRRRRRLNQIVPFPRKPRSAEYTCTACFDKYRIQVSDNPWWAVLRQECPKCLAVQIPRIDIAAPVNSIEHDPNVQALYGEGVEDSCEEDCEDESDDEDDDCYIGNGPGPSAGAAAGESAEGGSSAPLAITAESSSSLDAAELGAVTSNVAVTATAAEVEKERDVFGGEGLFSYEEGAKLLALMCHARTCTGLHKSAQHAAVCKSTKFLMLHIRDCSSNDFQSCLCKLPWCKPGKRMLEHLTHCYDSNSCIVCSPTNLPEAYVQLRAISASRGVCASADTCLPCDIPQSTSLENPSSSEPTSCGEGI